MTDETPIASIIVPSYRGARRLPALLDSFARQDGGTPAFEVIVVIDGVDDGSVALLAAEDRFPVCSIVFPENRGRVAALNAGFEAARGEVLIRCDDDLVPGDSYVAEHVAAHRDGDGGAIGLYLNQYDETAYSTVYGRAADKDFRASAYRAPEELRWRYWAGNCSITRAVWEKVGPYDPAYRLYGWEDVDYGYRIVRAGFPVTIAPSLETTHRVAAVTTESRARRAAHSGSARRIFEAEHGDAGLPSAIPPMSAWNLLVRASAVVTRAAGAARCGRAVDRIIRATPGVISRKLVALTVEGAALSGYRAPASAKEVF